MRLEKERLLNEAEIAALEKEISQDPELQSPYKTFAPEGAPIEEVAKGMKEAEKAEEGEGEAKYAEGGSLARELAKEKKAKEGETKQSEVAHTLPTE